MLRAFLIGVAFVGFVFLSFMCCLVMLVVIIATGQPIREQFGQAFTHFHFALTLPVALWPALAAHEFGHYAAARFCRVPVLRVALGSFIWKPAEGWTIRSLRFLGEWRVDFLRPADNGQFRGIIAAGPLASLVTGLLCVAVFAFVPPIIQCWAGFVAAWSLMIFWGALIPHRAHGYPSDGCQLWESRRQSAVRSLI